MAKANNKMKKLNNSQISSKSPFKNNRSFKTPNTLPKKGQNQKNNTPRFNTQNGKAKPFNNGKNFKRMEDNSEDDTDSIIDDQALEDSDFGSDMDDQPKQTKIKANKEKEDSDGMNFDEDDDDDEDGALDMDDDEDDIEDEEEDDIEDDDEGDEDDDEDVDQEDEEEEEEETKPTKIAPKQTPVAKVDQNKAKKDAVTAQKRKIEELKKADQKKVQQKQQKDKKTKQELNNQKTKKATDTQPPPPHDTKLSDELINMIELRLAEKNARTLFVKGFDFKDKLNTNDFLTLHPQATFAQYKPRERRAYIEFDSEEACDKAFKSLKNKKVAGKDLVFDFCGAKSKRPHPEELKERTKSFHNRMLYVTGFGRTAEPDALKRLFAQASTITLLKFDRRGKGTFKYAFVTYPTPELAEKAFRECHGKEVAGRKCHVIFALAKQHSSEKAQKSKERNELKAEKAKQKKEQRKEILKARKEIKKTEVAKSAGDSAKTVDKKQNTNTMAKQQNKPPKADQHDGPAAKKFKENAAKQAPPPKGKKEKAEKDEEAADSDDFELDEDDDIDDDDDDDDDDNNEEEGNEDDDDEEEAGEEDDDDDDIEDEDLDLDDDDEEEEEE